MTTTETTCRDLNRARGRVLATCTGWEGPPRESNSATLMNGEGCEVNGEDYPIREDDSSLSAE